MGKMTDVRDVEKFIYLSWGLKDSMASQLHFTRHRNTRSPQGYMYWVQQIKIRMQQLFNRVRAGQGAVHGVPAKTPSPTRMKTYVSAKPADILATAIATATSQS